MNRLIKATMETAARGAGWLRAGAVLAALVVGGAAAQADGQALVCEGVLGNSGEQGESLVQFAEKPADGMGVAVDRRGFIWSRAGDGRLNRYAVDGRQVGHYVIPAGGADDQLTLVGDLLVMQIRGQLYGLRVDAEVGASAQPMKVAANRISSGSYGGAIAAVQGDQIVLINLANGQTRPYAALPQGRLFDVELSPQGAVYVRVGNDVHKFEKGRPVEGWPRPSPGDRLQLIDGHWYGHAWHGTIRRMTEDMEPAPGVVLGGASGSFIGHLDEDPDLNIGRGMAKVGAGLFAVSGKSGAVLLLEWDEAKGRFEIVRRIGVVKPADGIALDRGGTVWYRAGAWEVVDGPAAALRRGLPPPNHAGQTVVLDGLYVVQPGYRYGTLGVVNGRADGEKPPARYGRTVDSIQYAGFVNRGAAVYRAENRLVLLVVDAAGQAKAFRISAHGELQGEAEGVALRPASPLKQYTSLGVRDDATLYAAADGFVVEFRRDGNNWVERRRWRSWGAGRDEQFGERIYLTSDGGRLWVSDTERHRVLVFACPPDSADLAGPLAAFGTVDAAGNTLQAVNNPQLISVAGDRAILVDAGNQRLLRLAYARGPS